MAASGGEDVGATRAGGVSGPETEVPRGAGPAVTIVVPAFQHARFLRRRLESIDRQTFRDFETVLLDDGSTDGSADILREYQERHPDRSRLVVNEHNGGSACAQWAKGIELARGEFVWIAETDDFCGPGLLGSLVAAFADEAVVLAYTVPRYVDGAGNPTAYQFAQYTSGVSTTRWLEPYTATADDEVAAALGIRNTIPNASAAVFRRGVALPIIRDERWRGMKMLGDWVFYLRLLRGRAVRFVGAADASFTHTPDNFSARLGRTEVFVREHADVIATIRELYPQVTAESLRRNVGFVREHFRWLHPEGLPEFARCLEDGDWPLRPDVSVPSPPRTA